jgi:hypothetical protein
MSATYAWIIDVDYVDSDADVGLTGPRNAPEVLLKRLKAGEGERFELWDDDDELYYVGRILYLDPDTPGGNEPLDDFGMPNAGATEICYPWRQNENRPNSRSD